MTARSRAAATASLVGAVWGCGASPEQGAALIAVSPPMAYNDGSSALLIEGGPFRPAYRFDTVSASSQTDLGGFSAQLVPAPNSPGTATVPIELRAVSWQSTGALAAMVPTGVPAGSYDVDVTDPRGQHTRLGEAFTSLGPDQDAPALALEAPGPGSLVGALTTVTFTLAADDGPGRLATLTAMVTTESTSTLATCTIPPATAATTCHFQFAAPAPSDANDTVMVEAQASDSAGNTGRAQASFKLAPRPSLTALAPSVGPASGGTAIDLRGTDFVVWTDTSEGSKLLLDDVPLPLDTFTVVSPTQITAVMPVHDDGSARLSVATGAAATGPMYFQFVAQPVVRLVSPAHGPVAGGTWVAVVGSHFRDGATSIQIDGNPLLGPCFVSSNRVEGTLPAGAAVGLVSVIASDPIGGDAVLSDGFTYDAVATDSPDGGIAPMPMSCGGGTP
jgi:hypothetical protein